MSPVSQVFHTEVTVSIGLKNGHSSKYDNVHGVQHRFITPGQRRHVKLNSVSTYSKKIKFILPC